MKKTNSFQFIMLLAFCLFSMISFAQGSTDLNNTFGEGITASSTSTNPRIVSFNQDSKKESNPCSVPKLRLTAQYSYLETGKQGRFPLGIYLAIGFRLSKNFRFVVDASGHSSKKTDQSLLRAFGTAGIEFKPQNCEKQPPISVFSRIAIGMMQDRIKNEGSKASGGSAAVAKAGAGFDINITPRMAVRLSGDYMIAFVNGTPQHNYQFAAGLNIGLSKN